MSELRLTRCPVCRARMTGDEPLAEPCRRCESDLSWVRAAERRAEVEAVSAETALRENNPRAALAHARRAILLVDAPQWRELLARALAAVGVAP